MSDITLHADYTSGLTGFNRDGLELLIHDDGSVYWHQKAGARMLGMKQGHLSSLLARGSVKGESFGDVLRFENASQYGIKGESFYGVDTLITLAGLYNPTLNKQFSLVGATIYLYKLAGYKVKVEAPTRPAQSEAELFRMGGKAMMELADIKDKLSRAPGLASKLESIPVSGYAMIEGTVDMYKIQELLAMLGAVVDPKMYPALSRALGIALASDGAIQRSVIDGIMVYPLSALPTLKTLLGSVLI